MKKVCIIHGYNTDPTRGWIPWLKEELTARGISAYAPVLPSPAHPSPLEWIRCIREMIDTHIHADDELILVGHSLGVAGILRTLQYETFGSHVPARTLEGLPPHTLPAPLIGVVLVSGRYGTTDNPRTVAFYTDGFDIEHIKTCGAQFEIIHGDKDPIVNPREAEAFGQSFHVTPRYVHGGGHLTEVDGYTTLPVCLEVILKICEDNS